MLNYLWTNEAVSSGHPDKVADQIADAILDIHLKNDPLSRVASEVTVTTDKNNNIIVFLTGEISSKFILDSYDELVSSVIKNIGYNDPIIVLNYIRSQSVEISNAVSKDDGEIGAGDQGVMFGYACNSTPSFMPLGHNLAFKLVRALELDRQRPESILLPDAKTQVTVEYSENHTRLHTVLISTQHQQGVTLETLRTYIKNIIDNTIETDENTIYLINPAGTWNVGGPAADTGLSGRKIVVDNYGADCPIGGGSFSGKDPTKVDRSGAYAARHIAKNLVAAGLANTVKVQLSYAIGVVEPVSIFIQTDLPQNDSKITKMVSELVSCSPKAIIDRFNLRQPIYQATASGGHFGRDEFPWEKLDLAEQFSNWWQNA